MTLMNTNKKIIDVYYHPTTVVFLDDHQAFLESIPLALEESVAYQTFSNPQKAIDYINGHTQYRPLLEKDLLWTDNNSPYHYKLDTKSILHKTLDNKRFSEPSILITDYAMPGSNYNGLDVCNAIDNPYVKKILLTGVADEQIAIEALNNKVIDYYLKKNAQDILPQVNELIQRYQQSYFSDMTRVIREGLTMNRALIDDPAIVGYFFALIKQEGIVEYHLQAESSSSSLDFLMLDEHGKGYRLVIFDSEDLENHAEVAADADAPEALLEALKQKSQAPIFPSLDGFYHPDMEPNWQNYFYPSKKIGSEKIYIAIFVDEAEIHPMSSKKDIFSFQQYMQHGIS